MEFMTLISNIIAVCDGRKKQRMQIREFACPIVTHTHSQRTTHKYVTHPRKLHLTVRQERNSPNHLQILHATISISMLGSSSFAHRKRLAFWSVAGLNCSFFFVSCFVLVIDEHLLRRRYFKMERKLNF